MRLTWLIFALLCLTCSVGWSQKAGTIAGKDRMNWLKQLDKISRPVLMNLASDRLKEKMPVVLSPKTDNKEQRSRVAYLEAFGRTLSGIAPWLNSEGGSKEEIALRNEYRQWTLKAISNSVDSSAKDYMVWNEGGQPLVDAAFFSLALIRCPWLWNNLDTPTKIRVVKALQSTRNILPAYSNWLLFSGMIETFFSRFGYEYDKVRIDYCIREFAHHWYVGDGVFSDGINYAWDYYNSYVIQPFLAVIVKEASDKSRSYDFFVPRLLKINQRYAEIQERLINADGSFPLTGRSIVYRGAAFQHLADMAIRKQLPDGMYPAQVRGALTAVINKTLEPASSFDQSGWLNPGVSGNQPDLADYYITTGSLYLCTNIFLPLGLPETDEFWAAPERPWTSKKVWGGQDATPDHALHLPEN
jgi:hypothetical protein